MDLKRATEAGYNTSYCRDGSTLDYGFLLYGLMRAHRARGSQEPRAPPFTNMTFRAPRGRA
eukprot:scaffold7809_cov43-Tisochrysis_lutea.AAC.1